MGEVPSLSIACFANLSGGLFLEGSLGSMVECQPGFLQRLPSSLYRVLPPHSVSIRLPSFDRGKGAFDPLPTLFAVLMDALSHGRAIEGRAQWQTRAKTPA